MENPKVAVIVLNWNGWKDTLECLESLYRSTIEDYHVIVVDNGSTDDSIERIREYCEGRLKPRSKFFKHSKANKPIRIFDGQNLKEIKTLYRKFDPDRRLILLPLGKNLGYAGGNNAGVKLAQILNVDYVCFLNNDAVVKPNTLKKLVYCAQKEDASIAGPLVFDYYRETILSAGIKLDLWRGLALHQRIPQKNVDCVEGSCMLVERFLLEPRGVFDEEFFAYWEETDLCMRARKKGRKIVLCPDSRIWHKVSWHGKVRLFNLYLLLINNVKFIRRYGTWKQKLTFVPYFVCRILPLFTLRSFLKRPLKTFKLIASVIFFIIFGEELLPKEAFL